MTLCMWLKDNDRAMDLFEEIQYEEEKKQTRFSWAEAVEDLALKTVAI